MHTNFRLRLKNVQHSEAPDDNGSIQITERFMEHMMAKHFFISLQQHQQQAHVFLFQDCEIQ